MELLRRLRAELPHTKGKVVLVTGPVGAGVGDLVSAFAAEAARVRTPVVRASCAPGPADPPVLRQLARQLAVTTADAGAVALVDAMLAQAGRGPLVVVVEDVQHLDEESRAGLLHLVRQLRTAPVLLVLTELENALPADPWFRADLIHRPQYFRIRLDLMTVSEVVRVLAGGTHREVAEQLGPLFHRITHGNLVLLRGLLHDCGDLSALRSVTRAADVPAGEMFGEAFLACLYRMGPEAVDAVRGLAVLGADSSVELLSRLLEVDAEALTRRLRLVNNAGLVETVGFRHPSARAAVLEDVNFTDRAERHYRTAELLDAEGLAPRAVAEHLVAANRAPDAHMHQALLQAAAAAGPGDAEFALRCLDLARRQAPDARAAAAATAETIAIQWSVSPARAIPHLEPLVEAWRGGNLRARDRATLVKALLWYGRLDPAREMLTELASEALTADLALDFAGLRYWIRSAYPALHAGLSRSLPAGSEDPEDPLGHLRTIVDGGGQGIARHAEDLLLHHDIDDWWPAPLGAALLDLVYSDHLKRARRWCERIDEEARRRGDRAGRGIVLAVQAEIARRSGDLALAGQRSLDCLALLPQRAWGVMIGLLAGNLIGAALAAGDHGQAREYLQWPVPEAMFHTWFGLQYLEARGHFQEATGRHQAALTDFVKCGELMRQWRIDLPALLPWRTGAAAALVGLGDRGSARRLLDEQLNRPDAYHPRIRGVALRIRAATVEPGRRVALLREAADLLNGWNNQFELLRALADLSRAYEELGDHRQAQAAARRVRRFAERAGAEKLADVLLAERDPAPPVAIGDTVQAPDLSQAETRVAILAARGYTNREIARKLYISVSTVEQHLTRVYRKLKVARRDDLPGRLAIERRYTA